MRLADVATVNNLVLGKSAADVYTVRVFFMLDNTPVRIPRYLLTDNTYPVRVYLVVFTFEIL